MKTQFYGVYLSNAKNPMALFIREDWASDFVRKMQRKNPSIAGHLSIKFYGELPERQDK